MEEVEAEQNEYRTLHSQLEATQELVKKLSDQLSDLRDQGRRQAVFPVALLTTSDSTERGCLSVAVFC